MKKIMFLLIGFIAYGAAIGNSAEPSPDSNQPPEAVLQTLRTKIGQTRAILSEIRDLLKKEDEIIAGTREQREQAKKTEASLAEYNRAADVIRLEIQKLRDQEEVAEKELAAQTKQEERYRRLQAEYAKEQKERLDAESRTREAESKLAAAQKNLAELKDRLTGTMKQVDDAKKRSRDLESAAAMLKTERTRRAEELARAENAVVMAEKAEKERLLLASRLAELERNLPSQQQDSPEQANLQSEIEREKKAIQETEEKIRKDEKAREETEKTIAALEKQLQALRKTSRGAEKESDPKRLQSQLANARKQRVEAEDRIKIVEAELQKNRRSIADLTNLIAAVQNQEEGNKKATENFAILTAEFKREPVLMKEVMARLDEQQRALKTAENEKNQLNKQLLRKREQTSQEGGIAANKLNEIRRQLAKQKKLRLEAETRLQAVGEKRDVLEKEKEQLKLALTAGHDQSKQISTEQNQLESELENEKKAVAEAETRIKNHEKARQEAEQNVVELKKQLQALQKAEHSISQKGSDTINRLQSQIAAMRNERAEADEKLKKMEGKIKESEESSAVLTNMIAAAERQQGKDKETAKAVAALTDELKQETVLRNEAAASIDKQNRNLKALEDERADLNQRLILVKESLSREEQNISKLDEARLQIAEQKKNRAELEAKLQQITRDGDALAEENKRLNRALIEAGQQILKNEKDFRKSARVAGELHKEKELARKSADNLRKQEEKAKQLADEKLKLQDRLNETETKLTQQKERAGDIEKKRQALASPAGTGVTRGAENMAGSSDKDVLAAEQDVLNKARAGGIQPSGLAPAAEAEQLREEKAVPQAGSRSRQNRLAQAEEHYALGIQKWDGNDMNGAVAEFKETIRLNPDAAGAYYNISLVYLRQGRKKEACDYAYQAGEVYIKINNLHQAARMSVLLMKIDQDSPLILKLRDKIAGASQ